MRSLEAGYAKAAAGVLIALIVFTRVPWAGAWLPDASVAAFFLGGLYLHHHRSFALLLVAALSADLVAFRLGLAPSACVTPAYFFLVPTYAVVWIAGRSSRRVSETWVGGFARTAAWLGFAISGAFVISNAAFFMYAPESVAMTGWEYASAVMRYLPGYAASVLLYAGPLLLLDSWKSRSTKPAPIVA